MASRNMITQQQNLIECIRLYKDLPTLWNVKNKSYYDRSQKELAYKILLRKYREWVPKATKKDLKKKLNSLRTSYRKEHRKYLASLESGSGPAHKPTLWYYNEMSFLHNQTPGDDAESPLDVGKNYAIIFDVDEENSNESQTSTHSNQETPQPEPETDTESTSHEPRPVTVVKKMKHDNDETFLNMSYENISDIRDEYFHWAMSCASDLRKMNQTQQVFAKKAIAEILMEGQLGMLQRHSVKVNEPQVYGNSSESSAQFGSSPTYIQVMTKHYPPNLDSKPIVSNPLEDEH